MTANKRSDGRLSENNAAAPGGPDRRELLTQLLAAALATAAPWPRSDASAAALPLARERFVELSAKLCAMPLDDGALGDAIQNGLAGEHAAEELRRIAELLQAATPEEVERLIAGSGLQELAKSIVSAWYSGKLGTGEETRVLAYEEALAWRATGYAKAPGTCGVFAEWTAAPQSALDPGRPR